MLKFSIQTNERQRVQIPTSREVHLNPGDDVEIAINVNRSNYVPDDVDVRARIDERLFTAVTKVEILDRLEQDPGVVSVQVGRAVHGGSKRAR